MTSLLSVTRLSNIVLLLWVLTGCSTNPITGRSQMIMFPESQDAALGAQAFAEVTANAPVVRSGADATRINRIGQRVAAVSDRPDMDWEFILIDEPVLNAWALPGGKIAVYRRMADELNDSELAAVLGHEVAHAVLRHGVERVSRAQMTQLALQIGAIAVATQTDNQTAQLALTLGALAAQGFVALPHSRFTELEADDIGTLYMARAGYDPRAAVSLWQKMARLKEGGGGPPNFLSTHPSDDRRITRIQAKMDVYMTEWRATR